MIAIAQNSLIPYQLEVGIPIAVIGAGTMGAGIAQLAAQCGHHVRIYDAQDGAAVAARERIAADLKIAVSRGRLPTAECAATLARIEVVERIEGLTGCGLAVEAIVERLEAKQSLLRGLEGILDINAVLATNTSSISITAVAQGLKNPQRVIGWHFFNPATRMKLVEVIAGEQTDPQLVAVIHALSAAWGKTSVNAPNTPGFLVNRVARPFYAEALRLFAEHVATVAAIDRLLREAGGFAMGPFELMDLIGIDVNLAVTESVFQSTAFDSRYAPHWIQQELVRCGRYGRKSGHGFYHYDSSSTTPSVPVVVASHDACSIRHAADKGLFADLLERLYRAEVTLTIDEVLPPGTLALGDVHIALTDGRTATERAAARQGHPVVLIDLAHDYSVTPVLGACTSEGAQTQLSLLASIFLRAGIELVELADVAGLVVMRTVCCLANEAADLYSWSRAAPTDIDTAMRLGTGYPVGPLAWADAIGPSRVWQLLVHLQSHYGDMRYRRAPQLSRVHFSRGAFHD